MQEIAKYLSAIDCFASVEFYRGHANSEWSLIPSLARIDINNREDNWILLEMNIMREFEKHASAIVNKEPKNYLEWLIHAQHHGLPTRLLDWSTNPLKALFFAVENPAYDHVDGIVFGVQPHITFVMEKFVTPENVKRIIGFHSSSLNPRVIAQEGCFTLSPLPSSFDEFDEINNSNENVTYLAKHIIPKEEKVNLRVQLEKLGITHKFLFPDLDGLAKSIIRNLNLYSI